MFRRALDSRLRPRLRRAVTWAFVTACLAACSASQGGDGLNRTALPAELRADYDVFAQRCSRCHSLSRPLNSTFSSMDQWRAYVSRMRRQPNSGITPEDETPILAFLQYFNDHRAQLREEAP